MTFKTDGHGVALRIPDAKLSWGYSTWGMRLSQLARQPGCLFVVTYSLPDMPYVRVQLARRPKDIRLICHSKFVLRAHEIRREFPGVEVGMLPNVHAKLLAIAPQTVWLGSANFGDSDWIETMIGIHSMAAYEWAETFFGRHWAMAEKV
jgi:hypothetical protein